MQLGSYLGVPRHFAARVFHIDIAVIHLDLK
jgi:hypothetical protein